jgi:hypothetical protein
MGRQIELPERQPGDVMGQISILQSVPQVLMFSSLCEKRFTEADVETRRNI